MIRHKGRIADERRITESFHLIPYPVYAIPRCVGASSFCMSSFVVYAALTHLINSFTLGRFPVISIPTRYILDATHVTPSIDTARIPSDSATSPIGRLPAAQRTGIAIGALKGIIDSVTDSVDPGSLSIANMLMNEATRSMTTGCCACRASCSLDDMAPTAANIDE